MAGFDVFSARLACALGITTLSMKRAFTPSYGLVRTYRFSSPFDGFFSPEEEYWEVFQIKKSRMEAWRRLHH